MIMRGPGEGTREMCSTGLLDASGRSSSQRKRPARLPRRAVLRRQLGQVSGLVPANISMARFADRCQSVRWVIPIIGPARLALLLGQVH
jgi:hypothetical protein